jgi:hypothetical protein
MKRHRLLPIAISLALLLVATGTSVVPWGGGVDSAAAQESIVPPSATRRVTAPGFTLRVPATWVMQRWPVGPVLYPKGTESRDTAGTVLSIPQGILVKSFIATEEAAKVWHAMDYAFAIESRLRGGVGKMDGFPSWVKLNGRDVAAYWAINTNDIKKTFFYTIVQKEGRQIAFIGAFLFADTQKEALETLSAGDLRAVVESLRFDPTTTTTGKPEVAPEIYGRHPFSYKVGGSRPTYAVPGANPGDKYREGVMSGEAFPGLNK